MGYIEACRRGAWSLLLWHREDPKQERCVRFRCRSWRHEGECSEWRGAQDFERVSAATSSRKDWVYVVLTYASKQWRDLMALYRATVVHWSALRKRLARRFGVVAYVQTWEAHRSGYPHVNLLIGNPVFFADAVADWRFLRRAWLEPNAVACGFGQRTWLEPMRSAAAMAGYLTKLSRELVGHGRKNQSPLMAPKNFRRLRASRGVLPPPYKDPDWTGIIERSRMWELDLTDEAECADVL